MPARLFYCTFYRSIDIICHIRYDKSTFYGAFCPEKSDPASIGRQPSKIFTKRKEECE